MDGLMGSSHRIPAADSAEIDIVDLLQSQIVGRITVLGNQYQSIPGYRDEVQSRFLGSPGKRRPC